MLGIICLWWVGIRLTAPAWYFWLLGIAGVLAFAKFAVSVFNAGKESA